MVPKKNKLSQSRLYILLLPKKNVLETYPLYRRKINLCILQKLHTNGICTFLHFNFVEMCVCVRDH